MKMNKLKDDINDKSMLINVVLHYFIYCTCTCIVQKNANCFYLLDYAVHKRTVNRISFHPTERDKLISGSQDGTMRYFVSCNVLYI